MTCLQVTDIRVNSLDIDFLEVSWGLADTHEDVMNYNFTVLRAESSEGPYAAISEPFQDLYLFIDRAIRIDDKWRQYHYKVRVTEVQSGQYTDFGPASQAAEPDLIALEIRRHIQILFREHAGRRLWLLPVRKSGQRCECWSPRLKQRTRSGCPTCFDTGYVRGYHHPIETFGQIAPSGKSNQHMQGVGNAQQQNTSATFVDYPTIKPDDILVERENRRWRVVGVSFTEKGRAIVHHELQLHEVQKRDMEYSVPLVLDKALRNLWTTPPRNFSNPHNLQNLSEEDLELFSVYRQRGYL